MPEATYFLLERCQKHNVFLKMSKSWFDFSSVKYFGYKVTYGKREMDENCKKVSMDFHMPTCQKEMQSFLGAALFSNHLFLTSPRLHRS